MIATSAILGAAARSAHPSKTEELSIPYARWKADRRVGSGSATATTRPRPLFSASRAYSRPRRPAPTTAMVTGSRCPALAKSIAPLADDRRQPSTGSGYRPGHERALDGVGAEVPA